MLGAIVRQRARLERPGFIGVRDHKRNVIVQVSHMGIEPSVLIEAHKRGAGSLGLERVPQV